MEKIRLYTGDWLYTSGLVGLHNILKHAGDEILVEENYLEFDSIVLENYERKFFSYLIDKYQDILSIYKIKEFEEFIDYHEASNFEEFNEKSLDVLNKYITDILKKQLKSNSYKSAYKLIDSRVDLLDLEKSIKAIKLKKKETLLEVMDLIGETFNKIRLAIAYMKLEDSRKYIGAKNVMYTVINKSWNNVSFLYPQTKEKDMYVDYRKDFVDPVRQYLEEDKLKFKHTCFACDRPIKNLDTELSFIKNIGFDIGKKASHVWDFQNDMGICPICKLVYSSVPGGINYVYDKGIYLNDNSSMESAINLNEKIYLEIYKNNKDEKKLTYRALVQGINTQVTGKIKYDLADIQLVRYEDDNYKFNSLSRLALKVIKDSEKDLDSLLKAGFKEINTYFNIYELVVARLLNGQNMFTLIQKLLYYKLSQANNSYFNGYHIIKIININTSFLRGVGLMQDANKDIVKFANASGYYLREKYRSKGSVDKLGGISYKLLNALKTNNKDSFMDTVLNCYLYAKEQVPAIILDTLRSDEEFKTIGYAFVTGLIEGEKGGKGGSNNE